MALAARCRARHRQRAPVRQRRALAEPARHGVLDGAGRPGPRRPRARFVRVNEAFAAFNRPPGRPTVGLPLADVLGPPASGGRRLPSYERVLSTGEALLDGERPSIHCGSRGAPLERVVHAGDRTPTARCTASSSPSSTSPSAVRCSRPSATRACARTSSRAPARSSTRRWTTRRRCATSPRSRSPRSPTGAR